MSASEIILAAGAAAVGVAAGSLAIYLYSGTNNARNQPVQASEDSTRAVRSNVRADEASGKETEKESEFSHPSAQAKPRSIPKSELEKSKRELRTLLVEKELVSAALTRLYEAEAAKEISKSEREVLGAKYVAELKVLDEKITKMDAFIQVGDLETLRNQLIQLVEQKIDSIDRRIESTRKLAEPLIAEMMMMTQQAASQAIQQEKSVDETQRGTPIPDISDMLQNERPEPRIDPAAQQPAIVASVPSAQSDVPKATPPPPVVERKRPADKVEELQKEILDALDRLERLDVDSA